MSRRLFDFRYGRASRGQGPPMVPGGGGAPPSKDPFWTSTILLCGCEGAFAAAASLADESFAAHPAGASGGSGAQDAFYNGIAGGGVAPAFGNSYAVFGSGGIRNDYVRFTNHADWTLGANPFTWEQFIYYNNANLGGAAGPPIIASHYNNIGNQRGWFIYNGGGTIGLYGSADGITAGGILLSPALAPAIQTWYYFCVERDANTFRIYWGPKGGTAAMVVKATNAISFFASSAALQLSSTVEAESSCLDDTFMDEIRVTKVARYKTDAGYAVPRRAFPRK